MIRLFDRALPLDLQQYLHGLQAVLDAETDYVRRVALAADMWTNRTRHQDFQRIRDILYSLCFGQRRCVYCEDSVSTEIEHVEPKSLYPEATFAWENLLPACSGCNGPKNNSFAVFVPHQTDPVQMARRKRDPVVPPQPGEPVLIHPRREDPLRFLTLDLQDTFHVLPRPGLQPREETRAKWTIDELLRLNREPLPQARRDAFDGYGAKLHRYITEPSAQQRMRKSIQRTGHRFVWEEMKAQRAHFHELRTLFEKAPEALAWPAQPWAPARAE